ncbi:MAG TPA: SDR family NAD(P)-dependent oxidoreductase [Ignavibacteriaceae bacterium]|nr:SDR family NAD(P)-dependent oxidoreductase [Ignavibacteriaceae bacterium]
MYKLKNKSILITGASSGIGLALARRLAFENCNLALLARRKEVIEQEVSSFEKFAAQIIALKCDVTKIHEVENAVGEIKSKFGKIDVAILNSGISIPQNITNFKSSYAKEVLDVNVFGLFNFAEVLIPEMTANKDGIIVGVSSLADGRGFPQNGPYSASKAAASIYLESLRVELKKYNIKVITVKPGFVRTPMTDKNNFRMPFLIDVEQAADIIIKGIQKERTLIQFPFSTSIGAKLLKIVPNFLFDLIANSYR